MFEDKVRATVMYEKFYKYIILFTINDENKWLEFDDIDILNKVVTSLRQALGHFDYKLIREEI